jgi:hypothetical protein
MTTAILVLAAVVAGGWYWLRRLEGELAKGRSELLVLQTVFERLRAKVDGK